MRPYASSIPLGTGGHAASNARGLLDRPPRPLAPPQRFGEEGVVLGDLGVQRRGPVEVLASGPFALGLWR